MDKISKTNNDEIVIAKQYNAGFFEKSNELIISKPTNSFGLYLEYHDNEIKQNKKIYKTSRNIIWAGFAVIIFGIILCFFSLVTVSIIATISGLITELISGTIFIFLTQSNREKYEYYKQLSFDNERQEILKIAENLTSDNKMIIFNKLVDNYCDRRKQ